MASIVSASVGRNAAAADRYGSLRPSNRAASLFSVQGPRAGALGAQAQEGGCSPAQLAKKRTPRGKTALRRNWPSPLIVIRMKEDGGCATAARSNERSSAFAAAGLRTSAAHLFELAAVVIFDELVQRALFQFMQNVA